MIDLWRRLGVTVRDLAFGLLLAGLALIPVLGGYGTQVGNLPTRPMDALGVAVVAVECLPLALRRRWPAVCLAVVSAGFAVDQLWGYHAVSGCALPIALLSAAAHLERFRWTTVAVASAAYVPLAVALARRGSTEGVTGFVTFYLALALAWGIGAWLRQSRRTEAEHRRHVAESTRAAERTRIARELHDVVTHHVTAMVVQTEAARYLTAAPERLDRTLTAITDTGRLAISDLRQLLDVLNPGHGTEPLSVPALVERTRRAGQPVEFTETGEPRAGSAGAAAYRVVQEALTNALKHAPGHRTEVVVRHGAKEIFVEVATSEAPKLSVPSGSVENGGAPAGPVPLASLVSPSPPMPLESLAPLESPALLESPAPLESPMPLRSPTPLGSPMAPLSPVSLAGSGRGLAGLRERVGGLGGEFTAGPEGGGFVVRARIPS